jgi:hypothetical protein
MNQRDRFKLLFGPPCAVWPMVCEDMDAARWARAYLIACGLLMEISGICS